MRNPLKRKKKENIPKFELIKLEQLPINQSKDIGIKRKFRSIEPKLDHNCANHCGHYPVGYSPSSMYLIIYNNPKLKTIALEIKFIDQSDGITFVEFLKIVLEDGKYQKLANKLGLAFKFKDQEG